MRGQIREDGTVYYEMKLEKELQSRRYVPDYTPPRQEEKPVCKESKLCDGCPYPASGFVCWSQSGPCMRFFLKDLRERRKIHEISPMQ